MGTEAQLRPDAVAGEDTARAAAGSWWRRAGRTIKSFFLWSHERGAWQYDVMVAVIALFVLLAPPRFFHDKPVYNPSRTPDIVLIGSDAKGTIYRVSAELLASYDPNPITAAQEIFEENLGKPPRITGIKPIEAEDGTVWYDVWVRE